MLVPVRTVKATAAAKAEGASLCVTGRGDAADDGEAHKLLSSDWEGSGAGSFAAVGGGDRSRGAWRGAEGRRPGHGAEAGRGGHSSGGIPWETFGLSGAVAPRH